MPSFTPRRWIRDRLMWARYRLSLVLFQRLAGNASLCMAVILVAPLWALFFAWAMGMTMLVFDGLRVQAIPFVVLMVSIAIPFELLCRWWRKLDTTLPHEERDALLPFVQRARVEHPEIHWSGVMDIGGPWAPHNTLEGWMVAWAFDPEHLRNAQAARLRSLAPQAAGKVQPRRL